MFIFPLIFASFYLIVAPKCISSLATASVHFHQNISHLFLFFCSSLQIQSVSGSFVMTGSCNYLLNQPHQCSEGEINTIEKLSGHLQVPFQSDINTNSFELTGSWHKQQLSCNFKANVFCFVFVLYITENHD